VVVEIIITQIKISWGNCEKWLTNTSLLCIIVRYDLNLAESQDKDRRLNHMSICPKNKSSKARRDSRRANWKMSTPTLVKCSKCGELMVPHRVCKACGSYNKKEVISVEE